LHCCLDCRRIASSKKLFIREIISCQT
jgi:hypothetical protein